MTLRSAGRGALSNKALKAHLGAGLGPQGFHDEVEIFPAANDRPVNEHASFFAPLDDRQLDRLVRTSSDGREHVFAFEPLGDAFALQLEAILVDRARYVDGEDERQVGLSCDWTGREERPAGENDGPQ
jgi:hypothetical protein